LSAALLTEAGLEDLKRGKRPFLLGDPDQPHAFSHRDDVVEALINLALASDDVEGRVFHAPVMHVTPRQLVNAFARAYGVTPKPFVAPRWLLRLLGLFSRTTRGMVEMLPQWQAPYLVDDSAYCGRFGARATTLDEGLLRMSA
jgi:nucleoside-diphosphate-sugar epimerase